MKAPKVKLPFSGSDGGAPLDRLKAVPGRFAELAGRLPGLGKLRGAKDRGAEPPGLDDDDDVPDYLKPTFVERHGQRIAVIAAYFLFVATLAGTGLYLWLNEEAILEAEKERRPSLLVENLKPEIVRLDEEGTETTDTTDTSEEPAPTGSSDESDADPDAEADAQTETETDGAVPAEEDVALLTPHPDPALIEDSPTGPLPKVAEDGRQPWRVYSRPHNALETRPRIAVVVADLGIADETTAQAIALPGPVSLALAPYSRRLTEYLAAARDAGHEVLLTLPMEPRDYPRSDPGPYALMTTIDQRANLERLHWVMSRATGYIGLANYQGSAFTADERSLRPVMVELAQRGLVYLDTLEDPTSAGPRTARIAGAPAAGVDVIADDDMTRAAIRRKLGEAEVIAKTRQTAVVLIGPTPMAMAQVRNWAKDLSERGIVLAPLSAVIRARSSNS